MSTSVFPEPAAATTRLYLSSLTIVVRYSMSGRSAEQKIRELSFRIQLRIFNRVSDISELADEIKNSGTYLIYHDKANYLSKIDTVMSEIALCEKNNVFDTEFTSKMKQSLDERKQFVLNYNSNFIEQRKIDYKYLWSKGSFSLV